MASEDSQDLLICYNFGCGQKYKAEENNDKCCVHHPGSAVFHDALKGWSCCKKRVTDFTEFLNIKGCTTACHSNVKPVAPEKPAPALDKETMIQLETQPVHRAPMKEPPARPSEDEPLVELKTTIGASLKAQLEKLSLNDKEVEDAADGTTGPVKIGTSCNNKGCRASFEGEQSNTETCVYHPGVPIFHEGMKYWTCCNRKTSDFDAFLNQEGCETGLHNWFKPKVSQEKQVRVDWHQTPSQVCISIFAKVSLPQSTCVKANRVKCEVEVAYEGGKSSFSKTFVLSQAIDPARSEVKLLGTKVEINMKKAENFSWSSLEMPPPKDSS